MKFSEIKNKAKARIEKHDRIAHEKQMLRGKPSIWRRIAREVQFYAWRIIQSMVILFIAYLPSYTLATYNQAISNYAGKMTNAEAWQAQQTAEYWNFVTAALFLFGIYKVLRLGWRPKKCMTPAGEAADKKPIAVGKTSVHTPKK